MTPEQRIAELEAKLTEMQKIENNGKDPELLAKAKDRARMSWMDVAFILGYLGMDESLGLADIADLKEQLIQRKYEQLSGANRTALSWQEHTMYEADYPEFPSQPVIGSGEDSWYQYLYRAQTPQLCSDRCTLESPN